MISFCHMIQKFWSRDFVFGQVIGVAVANAN